MKEWTFDKDVGELLYQLRNDDVMGRSWAASEMVKHAADREVVKALETAAGTDSYWFVRQTSLESLEKINPGKNGELLKKPVNLSKKRPGIRIPG